MRTLLLTVHFSPNLGGVETHLLDLIKGLNDNKIVVTILCYQPLSTSAPWKIYDKQPNLQIFRIPWVSGLFYTFIPYQVLQFLYLVPGLFLATPIILLFNRPDVIHAHGLVAALNGVFWGRIFKIPVVISTHSLYNFPKQGLYPNLIRAVFNQAELVLCLSNQSRQEVIKLGVDENLVEVFTYWVDLDTFSPVPEAKKKVGWTNEFIVLFVGRLVKEKGIWVLINSAKNWSKQIKLVIAGSGPESVMIKKMAAQHANILYLGRIEQEQLPTYYSGADLVIVPSTHEEGFGRVIIEALACGTPVIGANRGSIVEAMDSSVGQLIDVTEGNIKEVVEGLYNNRAKLKRLAQRTRPFAERRYSIRNVQKIIKGYQRAVRAIT